MGQHPKETHLGHSKRVLPVQTASTLDDPSSNFLFLNKQPKTPGPKAPETLSSPHTDYGSSILEDWTTPDTNHSPEKPEFYSHGQKGNSIKPHCAREEEPRELDDLMDYVELDDTLNMEEGPETGSGENRAENSLVDRNSTHDPKPLSFGDTSGQKTKMAKRKHSSYDDGHSAPDKEDWLPKKKQLNAQSTGYTTIDPINLLSGSNQRKPSPPTPEPTKSLNHQRTKTNERTSNGIDLALLEEFGDVADFL